MIIVQKESGKRLQVSELDIYDPPAKATEPYEIRPRSAFEEQIAAVRRQIWAANDVIKERTSTVRARYNKAKAVIKEYSAVIKAEKDLVPKAAAVSLAAAIGFTLAGRSRSRRILFPVVGASVTAGICFPNLAYVPAKRLYNRLKEKYLPKQSAITTEKKLSDGRQDNEIVIQPDPGQNNPKDTDMYTEHSR
ncbi:uncharacterized protein [Oscarella lobularis]|uniref:uncharacterized protein n=1 Tax=Oscarella lobularis TaxID=121494 RepID=UPI0033144D67